MKRLKYLHGVEGSEIIFDDFVEVNGEDKPGARFGWSQICEPCASKLEYCQLDEEVGEGICGVEGCSNPADHYIEFDCADIKLLEESK